MSIGYFLRLGDKTTCGGQILTGSSILSWHGKPAACEGDQVSCGKHSGVYNIVGGISNFINTGKPQAGTLDSHSSCPCRARFIPSITVDHYTQHTAAVITPPQTYRLRYLCQDDNGQPYRNRVYHLCLKNGTKLSGLTDQHGYTQWYELEENEEALIHIME